jgi:hypothetical protein
VEDNPNPKGIAMTQDEIIEMAIQGHASTRDAIRWAMNQEREACAKIADEWAVGWPHPSQSIAEWIRKRT